MNHVALIALVVPLDFSSYAFSGPLARPRLAVVNKTEIRQHFAQQLQQKITSQSAPSIAEAKTLRRQMLDWRVVFYEGRVREPKRYEEAVQNNKRKAEKLDRDIARLKCQIEEDFYAELNMTIRKCAIEIAIENRFYHVYVLGPGDQSLIRNMRPRGDAEFFDVTRIVLKRIERKMMSGD